MTSDVKLCAQVSECSPGDTGRRMASPYQELLSDRARAALGTIACGIAQAPGDAWRRPYRAAIVTENRATFGVAPTERQ